GVATRRAALLVVPGPLRVGADGGGHQGVRHAQVARGPGDGPPARTPKRGGTEMAITRRDFIRVAGAASLAAATDLRGRPRAEAAASLKLLAHSSYNEDSDKAIDKLGKEFAAKNGAEFSGDFIDQPEVAAKLTAEEQAQAGHDIVDLQDNLPTIHKSFLVPLDDVVADIVKRHGEFFPIAKDSGYVDGHWLTLPWLGNAVQAVYRADYLKQVG